MYGLFKKYFEKRLGDGQAAEKQADIQAKRKVIYVLDKCKELGVEIYFGSNQRDLNRMKAAFFGMTLRTFRNFENDLKQKT
jgi:hypothetical protein